MGYWDLTFWGFLCLRVKAFGKIFLQKSLTF